jgi:hypothetical protein
VTSGATYILSGGLARREATRAIFRAHEGMVVEVREPTRTNPQNARLHAHLSDIVKSGYELHGETYDEIDDWKTFFVSVWMGETGRGGRLVRGINNEVVQLYWRTSRMNKEQLSEMIVIVERFCAERNIPLRDAAEEKS